MELHYRGVTYNANPDALETEESNVVGHYRGATWHMRKAKSTPASGQPKARVKYRGAWVR
jgi:hypothetical protein